MYVYLYDNFLRQRKFDATVKEMETRLTDFGIAGKILRLVPFTNAEALIEEEKRRGADTVVIVGNDTTFAHVLSRAARCDILFGFLPVGPENTIAEVLGIPANPLACEVLSKRRKVKLDVGWFNNRYFVSQLHIPPAHFSVEYDEQFHVTSEAQMELVVCNLQPFRWKGKHNNNSLVVHPQDGKLEAFLRPVVGRGVLRNIYEEPSIFPFEEMIVKAKEPFLVEADGRESKETKITIKLAKHRLEMIVGKERKF
ncbi:MAG: diacylglycerol kinase family protein, partial [Patescibacteria group bacterium]